MIRILGDEDVRAALTMSAAVEAVESMCLEQSHGAAIVAERINLRLPNGWMRLMAGALPRIGVAGYKQFHLAGNKVRYTIFLYDVDTGEPRALMDAKHITAMRTGAAAAVALKHLTSEQVETVSVIGSGDEAWTQVEAMMAVRRPRVVMVFSRNPDRRRDFAERVRRHYDVSAAPVDDPVAAVGEAQVLLAATNTAGTGPAVYGQWLRPGIHVNSIGSTLPEQRELDVSVWSEVDCVVVDTPTLFDESGDAIAAREAGTLRTDRILTLADLAAQPSAGRKSDDEKTMYKSVGTALQDVAVAWQALRIADSRGLGTAIENFHAPKEIAI